MPWFEQVEMELQRVQPGENPGRTRTIARRAAGMALQQLYHESGSDFLALLKKFSADSIGSSESREAARRLCTHLSSNFQAASTEPVRDARSIIEFVKKHSSANG